ncbi:Hypothetical protein PHPALM_5975 [Phytophthora palmivora]|uniref:Uncharacterized protein n=1 Tax=Phytophthora palmivora TaxID=4796 RepID=A0A2P4YG12_9STRA|nr:Hypothetical protein PHPALM_5975 [Phytophthora palmivora]
MVLDVLTPWNTKRAEDTVTIAFKAFVKSEHVKFDYVTPPPSLRLDTGSKVGEERERLVPEHQEYINGRDRDADRCIKQDTTGECFVSVLDKFGMYLALKKRKRIKMWLFELFPVQ